MATKQKSKKPRKVRTKLADLPKVIKGRKPENKDGFPVDHYTASSMRLFTTNPILFKIEYMNGDRFDTAQNISGVLGKAFHTAMEVYYGGSDELIVTNEAEAIEYGLKAGMEFLELYPDGFIKYSTAMPSKQKAKERFAFAFNEYIAHRPYDSGDEILGIEEKIEEHIDIEWRGQRLTLPIKLKGYLDKIVRSKDGRIRIHDYKTAYAFTPEDKIDGAKIIQAVIYYLLAYAKYGEEPHSVVYEEIKYTGNKEKSEPNIREYEMVFAENDQYFDFFFRLYDDITRALSGEMVYVPNVSALFDNEVALIAYIHRLDINEETAKLMKKHHVDNLTDLLKKKIQTAGSMRKLLQTVEKQFVSATNLNYDKMKNEEKIQTKMLEHGMMIQFDSKVEGASVDLYRYTPSIGLKMSKIGAYIADVEQVLGVTGVRALAPIPNTSLVGFEVPRKTRRFPKPPKAHGFEIAIGETVMGEVHRFDLREAPHILIGGSSGGGKSVWLHGVIQQLMETPNVDLHLFDPKKVELNQYEGEVKEYKDDKNEIKIALRALTKTMHDRYAEMKKVKAKNIREVGRMRYKVVIIDEFAELAMGGEVGDSIKSLSQMGRAAGIHLIIATQRASTKVIDGDIKVNFPTKVVFKMAKAVDSTIMLDEAGAEKLLGKGDMLFASEAGIMRLQGYNTN